MTGGRVDVAVVGDGPAGLALAAACADVGLSVTVRGTGAAWRATYATWRDDVPDLPDGVFASITPRVDVVGVARRRLERPYAVFDNDALRAHLLGALPAAPEVGPPTGVADDPATAAAALGAREVVVATGGDAATVPAAWQTAYGVVLPEVPPELDLATDAVTLMDWRCSVVDGPPSFCYVVPVADGWLVEETVLAASPAVAPGALRERLANRLGAGGAAIDRARRVEEVRIPMGVPIPMAAVPRFGAAAGFVHPATGYSVAASLRAAPRVARAIADGGDVHTAVWPRSARRARALHDYGLAALLRLDAADTAAFFDAFFELPVDRWAPYLRVDVTPGEVAGVMRRVFRRAPWRVRRRLMAGDPRVLRRLLAAS